MAVYLLGFTLSLVLIACGEKKRLPVFLAFSAAALLIPCLIAGLRAPQVGTDVMVYVRPLTQAAISSDSFNEFLSSYWFADWRNLYVQNYEIGFSFLVYLVAKLTGGLAPVLFVIQAVITVPIYIALARNRKQLPVWVGMAVFYLLFFNSTLNMMRQWAAMGFLLLSFQMLTEKKYWLTALFGVIAFFFHSTAIVVLPVYFVYWFLWLFRRDRLAVGRLSVHVPTIIVALLFLVGIVAILNLPLIIKLMSLVGLDRFNSYLEGEQMTFMVNQIILRLPLFAVFALCWKDMLRKHHATFFFMAMLAMDIVSSQLVSVDINAIRISYYFSIYSVFWLPKLTVSSDSRVKRVLITLFILAYGLFYWYYAHVLTMRHETYPYAFTTFV